MREYEITYTRRTHGRSSVWAGDPEEAQAEIRKRYAPEEVEIESIAETFQPPMPRRVWVEADYPPHRDDI